MKTAVYVKNDRIQAAFGGMKGGRAVVRRFYEEPLGEGAMINGIITDEYAVSNALKNLWRKHSLPNGKVYLIAEGRGISYKLLEAPRLKGDKMLSYVKQEFADNDNYQNMIYDYSVREEVNRKGGTTILACMAEPEFVKSYTTLFKNSGIKLAGIDTALNCRVKLLEDMSEMKNLTCIIAQAETNTVSLTLFVNGKYSFSSRTRLTEERETDGFAEETARMISSMIQFNKAGKTGFDVTAVRLGGFSQKECASLKEICRVLDISVEMFSGKSGITVEKGGNAADMIDLIGGLV